MSGGRFNSIVILDCIPEGERNTARNLKESLEDLACYYREAEGLVILYYRIEQLSDLKACAKKIQSKVELEGLLPWFHIEGHGLADLSGFEFANRTECSWVELKKQITPINIESNCNVVIVLATCFGGNFARAIETTDRAPVLALVGPTKETSVGEIEKSFPVFYTKLVKEHSFEEALAVLDENTSSGNYYRTSSKKFFYDAWANYKITLCTPGKIHERAKQVQKDSRRKGVLRVPGLGSIKRQLKSYEKPLFNKFRDTYFMYDLNTENIARFNVSYSEAEEIVKSYQRNS